MGIYFRYTAAFLTLCLFSLSAHSATRVSVPVSKHAASDLANPSSTAKVGDTLRIGGPPLQGEYIPSDFKPSKGTKLPAKVNYDYSIPRTIKKVGSKIKGGLVGAAVTVGIGLLLDQVGAFIDENQQVIKHGKETQPTKDLFWCAQTQVSNCRDGATNTGNKKYSVPSDIMVDIAKLYEPGYAVESINLVYSNATSATYELFIKSTTSSQTLKLGPTTMHRYGSCVDDYEYNPLTFRCERNNGVVPLDDSDFDIMEAYATAQDSDFITGLLRDACDGSLSPDSCLESLRDDTFLSGPSSVQGPSSTSTTTFTKPDGTTGTTTTVSNTNYNVKYGDNYYDYSKSVTKVTTADGEPVSTETETEGDELEEEAPEDEHSFSDSDLPEVPSFYDQKYPDGLQGVWQNISSQVDQSAFMQFLQGFVPSFSGSCPAFGLGFNIASWANYGTMQFSSICYALDFVKIILLVTALFTFRKVTFGG